MRQFTQIAGETITTHTATFPARRYTYRHNTVYADGVKLQGFIQVRFRHGRMDVLTCFGDCCVTGSNPQWLYRMNAAAKLPS
jgi:hypothetical protein